MPVTKVMVMDLGEAVYNDVTTRHGKFRLTSEEYHILAQSPLRAFPRIPKMQQMSETDCLDLWHWCFREKFRNTRTRRDRNHPLVQGHMKGPKKAMPVAKNVFRVKNLKPEAAEDDTSVVSITKLMQQDHAMPPQRHHYDAAIALRMDNTYAARRGVIKL